MKEEEGWKSNERRREKERETALCSVGLVNTTLAFLFVLFASIFPRLKSRVDLSRGKKTAQNVVGRKRGADHPVPVVPSASRCIGTPRRVGRNPAVQPPHGV